jgi:hypothetical protein
VLKKKRRSFVDETNPVTKGEIWVENQKDWINHSSDEKLVEKTFKEHPFGLKKFKDRNANFSLPIKFLGVQKTFRLVDPMAIVVAREIEFNSDWENVNPIRGLRKIVMEDNLCNKNQHRIFYEVACIEAVYVISGSTDFSGHGRQCKEHMDCLFAFLAARFNLQIEEVTIPYYQAESIKKLVPFH